MGGGRAAFRSVPAARRPLLPAAAPSEAAAPGGAAEPSPSPPPALRSRPRAPAPRGDEPAERVLTPVLPPQAALAAPGPVEAGMLEKFELEEEGECPALRSAPPWRPGPGSRVPTPGRPRTPPRARPGCPAAGSGGAGPAERLQRLAVRPRGSRGVRGRSALLSLAAWTRGQPGVRQ